MNVLAALLLAPAVDLSFEHEPGRVWLPGTLNGQRVNAILDSGASGLFAFEDAAARARGTKGAAFGVTGTGEAPTTAWHAGGLSFGIQGTNVALNVPYIVAPAPQPATARALEVAAGFDFLLRYAVEIDYRARRLRLYSPWTYRAQEGFTEYRVRFSDRRPILQAEMEIPGLPIQKVDVMVDTGAPDGLEVTRKMALRAGLDERFKEARVEPGPGGLSGPTKVRRVRGVHVRIAGLDVGNAASISMMDGGANGKGATFDVLLGDAALRRFDVVFDYWHGRVYFRPNGA